MGHIVLDGSATALSRGRGIFQQENICDHIAQKVSVRFETAIAFLVVKNTSRIYSSSTVQ